MTDRNNEHDTLILKIETSDNDQEELDRLSVQLSKKLKAETEIENVKPIKSKNDIPVAAKSGGIFEFGSLLATLPIPWDSMILSFVNSINDWLRRRVEPTTVSVIIGEDKLEISNVNLEEKQKIIDMWIERQKSKIKDTERKN